MFEGGEDGCVGVGEEVGIREMRGEVGEEGAWDGCGVVCGWREVGGFRIGGAGQGP